MTTNVLCLFNGWGTNIKNYPSEFYHNIAMLLTIWAIGFQTGQLDKERYQVIIGSGTVGKGLIKVRFYNQGWTEWV